MRWTFNLVSSWFTCWSFSWYSPLTGTLRGTSREVAFTNMSAIYLNASLCGFPSSPSVSQVMDYVVNELNTVWHTFLHLWRIFLACWFFGGKLCWVWDLFRSCFGDVCLMASVLLYVWPYVPAGLSMCCTWWSIVLTIVNYYSCSWWG